MSDPELTEDALDLDALVPRPRPFTFRGQRYHVRAVIDLPMEDYLRVLDLDEKLAALPASDERGVLENVQAKLRLILIDPPDEVLGKLSYPQAVAALARAWAIARRKEGAPAQAERPQTADPASGGSSSASPGSAVSTAGGAGS